ncbi:hypothetical protein SAMN06298224_0558 [Fibrobacter sp. UWB16]|uniref:hypothetical protein n=1 Tax=unclassified Fibrobacter TaxID=2634177 RepID=UPI000B5243FB|nr:MULTISPECIES: hypothetical protein [unclassified Fibrobacter]OWV21403.1 hypothetical protein B7991_05325 [Fibrobacter sp. UWB3]SOD12191.1 hypothetical protein SAMN06298224_0558 [Fibrobacter sp. UWB16]
MGKVLLSLALAAAFAIPSFAQDIVILKNGTSIDAKVLEVDDNSIRYKKFDNPEGPTYTAKKDNISEIRYKNGTKETFNNAQKRLSPDKDPNSIWWTKARETKLGFWMDPLGCAQWGPMVGMSIRMGTNFDVKAYVRYYNGEFPLNDETFDDYEYEYYDGYSHYERGYFDQGFGIGLEFSKLFATIHGNWHTGFLFEIATIKFNDSFGFEYRDRYAKSNDSYMDRDYYTTYGDAILDLPITQYIFALTGGYTLRFNNRFFIDFSLQSGILLQILEDTKPYFYGDASLKLGIEF